MKFNKLIYREHDGVVTIINHNPRIRNALDIEMRKEMVLALAQAETAPAVRVIVLKGDGEHFSAGGSVKDMAPDTAFKGREYAKIGIESIRKIVNMDKPVIAAVDGYALGAGFSFVLASDLAIATDRAKFSQAFVNVGLTPDYASCYFLPRAVGLKRAKELIFTGRMMDANQALELGIVNQVVPPEKLDEAVNTLAQELANGPANAITLGKRLINSSWELDLNAMFEFELMSTAMCFQTEDHREGMQAFFEKRAPLFKGK
ncbi:MAG: enoyl-CoA hydratase [Deltaproteobacteria bacterium]|nr:enoyl-CoA hydratase [Deltaproteobacteria bacterium]